MLQLGKTLVYILFCVVCFDILPEDFLLFNEYFWL